MANNKKNEIPEYNGLKGIRATLNSYGYSNDEIGFDDKKGTVTLGGRDFMTPEVYDSDNGITYANEQSIRDSLKNFNDPVVEVTPYYSAYAGKNNLPFNAVGFSDGVVTLGGKTIPHTYIDENNKAWAKQSELDNALWQYKKSTGIDSNYDVFDKYENLYGDEIKDLIYRITDRDEFEYDMESDPVYKSYKAMYEREGNRMAEDTMAAYSAQTGGYANSAAVTAAANARQYYSEKLNDVIPQLEEMAYNRYMSEYERDLGTLNSLRELYTDMFSMEYMVNRDTAEDLYRAVTDDIERDRYTAENNRENMLADLEYMLGIQELNSNYMFDEQNYRLGEQKIKKNDQDYLLGEQEYRMGEQELVMEQIRQEILEQEKILNGQQMRKNEQSIKNNAQTQAQTYVKNAQNITLNEQKIRKNEQEIQMNDLEYSIEKYKRDIMLGED